MSRTLFAALLATALFASNTAVSATMDDSKQAIGKAKAAIAKAAKVGYEWRDTGKILGKAKAAEKEGDYNLAVTLAGKAERQAINAVKQHDTEMLVFKDRM